MKSIMNFADFRFFLYLLGLSLFVPHFNLSTPEASISFDHAVWDQETCQFQISSISKNFISESLKDKCEKLKMPAKY